MLTNIEDMDVTILSNLNLKEVRLICQTNKTISTMCQNRILKRKMDKVKKRVDHLITILRTRATTIKLLPKIDNVDFKDYYDILKDIPNLKYRIFDSHKKIDQLVNYTLMSITLNGTEYMTIKLYENDEFPEINLYLSKNTMTEILTHFYYNQLLLIF